MASASGDTTVKVWDTRGGGAPFTLRAHNHEVLSLDWNKYKNNTIVTASADRTACVWDLRSPLQPLARLEGHTNAVRRVKCDPHHGNIIATASYDTTVRLWDYSQVRPIALLAACGDAEVPVSFCSQRRFSMCTIGTQDSRAASTLTCSCRARWQRHHGTRACILFARCLLPTCPHDLNDVFNRTLYHICSIAETQL